MTAALAGTTLVLAALLVAGLTARRPRRPALLRVPVSASGRRWTGR